MTKIYIDEVYSRAPEDNGWIIIDNDSEGWNDEPVHTELFPCKCQARLFVGDFIDKRFKLKKPCRYCELRKNY